MSDQPEPIMQFFSWEHLPPHLQAMSSRFSDLAREVVVNCPRNPERTVALRKLLEAKDAAVRALIFKQSEAPRPLPTSVPPGPGP